MRIVVCTFRAHQANANTTVRLLDRLIVDSSRADGKDSPIRHELFDLG